MQVPWLIAALLSQVPPLPPVPAETAPELRFELAATFTLPDDDHLDNLNRPFRAVALRIPHAYVLERTGRLHVFEVPQAASPVEPQALRAIEDAGDGNDLIVRGDVLLCCRWGHLEAYSLADPAAPRHLGKFGPPRRYCTSQSIVGGEHAFVIGGNGIFRYDLGNPAEPRFVAAMESDHTSSTGCVAGGYLYVGELDVGQAGRQGITVYDVSDPARIREVAFLPTSRGPYDLFAVTGNRLLACLDADTTVHSGPEVHGNAALLDVADPFHPRLLWEQGNCGGRAAAMLRAGAAEYLVCNGDIFRLERDGLKSAAPFRGLRGTRRGFEFLNGSTADGLPYHGHGDGAYAALALDRVTLVIRALPRRP
jgi:hypothetical protein